MKIKQTVLIITLLVVACGLLSLTTPIASVAAETCAGVKTVLIHCDQPADPGGDITQTGIWGILIIAINILTTGLGIVAVAGIVYGSVLYTSAGGSVEQTKKAKVIIFGVIIGLIAYALMFSFLQWLIPGGLFSSAKPTTPTHTSTTTTTPSAPTTTTKSATTPAGSVNVKDYGATGNGTTDDTAAIQRAIDAVAASGGTVIFPAGTYKCLNVRAKSNVNLVGNEATLIKSATTSDTSAVINVSGEETTVTSKLAIDTKVGTATIEVASAKNFAQGDYIIIRDNTYKYDQYGRNQEFRQIKAISGNTITLTEATIGSYAVAKQAEVVKMEPVANMKITGLTIKVPIGTHGAGIYGNLAYNVTVENCTVTGAWEMGGIIFERSAYVNINNNTIQDGQDIASGSGSGYGFGFGESSHNCVAQNNYTSNIRENFLTDNTRYCSIINNTDVNAYDDSYNTHGRGSEHSVISNNKSTNSRGYGICVSQDEQKAPDIYVTVQGNTITNAASDAISVPYPSSTIVVSGNTIK
jgi:polygalacturonase